MQFSKKSLILSLSLLVLIVGLTLGLRAAFLKPKRVVRPRVAIVIDDWGYNLRYIDLLREMDIPVTMSILPNLRHSSKIVKIAHSLGQEVVLHLPLEPEDKDKNIGLEKHTISSSMSFDEVTQALQLALNSVSSAEGVSNHMGSRATTNTLLMSLIFAELKKSDLFFLDNLVTDRSVCRQLAKKMGVKFISRDVFLDNLDDYEYIKGQFDELTELALGQGQAVGVGHARETTLKVFKDLIPLMQEKGISFVFVSELLEE